MARNAENTFPKWLHYFDTINSTNNYAMKLIDDGLAQEGEVIWAANQTEGKGQRGKRWENSTENIMMSLIIKPTLPPDKQFGLSMAVAITIAKYLQNIFDGWQVAIKWPNDIYLNDKKTCGILIENVFKGMHWSHAVIGMGINVNQKIFPSELSNATSLSICAHKTFDLLEIITDIRSGLMNTLRTVSTATQAQLLRDYNDFLFRRNKEQRFLEKKTTRYFDAFVQEVNERGQLLLLTHKGIESYEFGELEWVF